MHPNATAFWTGTSYAAQNGARIINASFGGPISSSFESAQIDWLNTQGVLVAAAAGNGGSDFVGDDNDVTPTFPASYPQPNIVSVAAVDRSGKLTTFSNFGALSVDIAAPGSSIFGADVDRVTTYLENYETDAPGWTVQQLPGSLSTLDWNLWTDGSGNTWATDSTGFFGDQIPYQEASRVLC